MMPTTCSPSMKESPLFSVQTNFIIILSNGCKAFIGHCRNLVPVLASCTTSCVSPKEKVTLVVVAMNADMEKNDI